MRSLKLQIRAERRIGELLKEMEQTGQRAKRGRPEEMYQGGTFKLDDIGISRNESSRFQKIASMPEKRCTQDAFRSKGDTYIEFGICGRYSTPERPTSKA